MEKPREAKSTAVAIRQFLEECQPKLPEARGFLQFLLTKDEIIRRIEIVSDISEYRHAILISAKGSGTWPFLYRKGDRYYFKTSQAVVELMKFIPDRIGLCLSTQPPEWSPEREEFLQTMARWHDEVFQDEVKRLTKRQDLLDRIDEALASGDRSRFEQLAAELKHLN